MTNHKIFGKKTCSILNQKVLADRSGCLLTGFNIQNVILCLALSTVWEQMYAIFEKKLTDVLGTDEHGGKMPKMRPAFVTTKN